MKSMKFECVECGAKYFHNFFTDPKKKMESGCRFCGGEMKESKMTPKEFGEIYMPGTEDDKVETEMIKIIKSKVDKASKEELNEALKFIEDKLAEKQKNE